MTAGVMARIAIAVLAIAAGATFPRPPLAPDDGRHAFDPDAVLDASQIIDLRSVGPDFGPVMPWERLYHPTHWH